MWGQDSSLRTPVGGWGGETQERQRKGRRNLESEAWNSRCLIFFLLFFFIFKDLKTNSDVVVYLVI
jgi:hypothetical protein